jgi:hypothetical protein
VPYDPADPKWVQFRRLLLGTMVECLAEAGLAADLATARIEFDRESEFRVPRLDNAMRFKGRFTARATSPPPEAPALEALRARLAAQWPVLVSTLDVIPLGDRLTPTRNELAVSTTPDGALRVVFDLEAD